MGGAELELIQSLLELLTVRARGKERRPRATSIKQKSTKS